MAGDVAAMAGIALTVFLVGALSMLLIIVAVGISMEDRSTRVRRDRQLALRRQAPSYMASGVRRLVGIGQRVPQADSQPRPGPLR